MTIEVVVYHYRSPIFLRHHHCHDFDGAAAEVATVHFPADGPAAVEMATVHCVIEVARSPLPLPPPPLPPPLPSVAAAVRSADNNTSHLVDDYFAQIADDCVAFVFGVAVVAAVDPLTSLTVDAFVVNVVHAPL